MRYDDRDDQWSDEAPVRRPAVNRPRRPAVDAARRDWSEPWRRVRAGLSSMYEAVSREVRALRYRAPRYRRGAPYADDWSDYQDASADRPDYRRQRDAADTGYDAWQATPPDSNRALRRGPSAAPPARRTLASPRKKHPRLQGCLLYAALCCLIFVTLGGGLFSGYAYAISQQYADTIATLSVNRLFQTTRIFDRNGKLLFQTYGQDSGSRIYISYCQMPESIKIATVDTEDATFWSNPGVNFLATLRSAFIDTSTSSSATGASTITQQLVKLNVLGDERRNIGRKMNEAVLALGVTQQYTKPKILEMYLNTIPYGRQNYGIEAAAQNYFHLKQRQVQLDSKDPFDQQYIAYYKNAGCSIPAGATYIWMSAAYQLQPWQAMLLAGIPQAPSGWDMFDNPDGLVHTRMVNGVMRNVQNQGHGDTLFKLPASGQYDLSDPGQQLAPATPDQIATFTYNFITATDANKNPKNIFLGAFQNSSGQSTKLAPHFVDYVIKELSDELPGGFSQFASLGWNIYTTLDYGNPDITAQQLAEMTWDPKTGALTPDVAGIKAKIKDPVRELAEITAIKTAIPQVGIQQFAEYVVNRDIKGPFPDYWYCGVGFNAELFKNWITQDSAQNPFAPKPICAENGLNGAKNVHNAALTAIDPRNGDILAMVGSVDYNSSDQRGGGEYNVATAPQRSLGSSFKPIVYATAFQMGWNPGIVIRDEPTCFPSAPSGQSATDRYLCPNNYLSHNYTPSDWAGPHPITYELGNSLNTPAEMALSFAGVRADYTNDLLSMAQRLGIDTLDPAKMGPATALGAQGVPLLEETSAYGTFANGGYRYPPRSILTVTDPLGHAITDGSGKQLFKYEAIPSQGGYQAISPEAAYMITSVLTNNNARIADFGPSNPLHFWGRDVAAKTGTSQDVRDIVTMGYTPWLSLGVWAGNNDNTSMVRVIGIAGAAYIFHDVMQFAITRLRMPGTAPSRYAALTNPQAGGYFSVPGDLHLGQVNCHTGLAPWAGEDMTHECNPASEAVPLFLTPEFDTCAVDDAVSPILPNETKHCFNGNHNVNGGTLRYADGWGCYAWGCLNQTVQSKGYDTTWLINGQDPLAP